LTLDDGERSQEDQRLDEIGLVPRDVLDVLLYARISAPASRARAALRPSS
jgi:hypothetical protein